MDKGLAPAIGIEATAITCCRITSLIAQQLEVESQLVIKHRVVYLCTSLKFLLVRALEDTLQISVVDIEDIVRLCIAALERYIVYMAQTCAGNGVYPIGIIA